MIINKHVAMIFFCIVLSATVLDAMNYTRKPKQLKVPLINPFKEETKKNLEVKKDDIEKGVASINAYLKKTFLSFHHMDEYDLEITKMRHLKKASWCSYAPKSDFYRQVVSVFKSSYVRDETILLVVTGIKHTVDGQELRKLFIPLRLQKIEWLEAPLVWEYQEFNTTSFVWKKDKRMWGMPLLKGSRECSPIFLPLEFLSTDQEFIERESYWKLYFSKDVWNKKLQKILAAYNDGSYRKMLKAIPAKTCCYRFNHGACVDEYGSGV